MRNASLELKSKGLFEIILALNKSVVEAFETSETQDTKLTKLKNDANDHMKEFVQWLFGVTFNQIPEIKYEVDPNDAELVEYAKER